MKDPSTLVPSAAKAAIHGAARTARLKAASFQNNLFRSLQSELFRLGISLGVSALSIAALGGLLLMAGCSSDKADKEPTVAVQVAAVEKTTIQHTIHTQAILFPRQQAAIVPKISAPVQKFLVKRGSRVHKGELLAVLENRDLSAAV